MDIPQKQPRLPLEIKLVLADTNPDALEAWRHQFAPKFTESPPVEGSNGERPDGNNPSVEIHDGDFLEVDADALIVPGNSFGFLDGGVELRVSERLGMELQDRLRGRIRADFSGELLVGQALIEDLIPSEPAIIYTPIWRTPQDIETTVNVFLAAKSAFQALADTNSTLKRIAAPAMGIGVPGHMDPFISARQFRYAYEIAIKRRSRGGKNLTRLIRRERKMKTAPNTATEEAVSDE